MAEYVTGSTGDFISRKASESDDESAYVTPEDAGGAVVTDADDANATATTENGNGKAGVSKLSIWKYTITVRDAIVIALVTAAVVMVMTTWGLFLLAKVASTPTATVSPEHTPGGYMTVTVDGHTIEASVDAAATTRMTVTAYEHTVVASIDVRPALSSAASPVVDSAQDADAPDAPDTPAPNDYNE